MQEVKSKVDVTCVWSVYSASAPVSVASGDHWRPRPSISGTSGARQSTVPARASKPRRA